MIRILELFRRSTALFCALMGAGLLFSVIIVSQAQEKAPSPKPLKALLIAGGCCHDYKGQHEVLFKGIQSRANVQVDVVWTDDKSVNPPLPIFDNPNWADGYDVVIHDECAAGNKNPKVMKHILDTHKKVPAVHLHCAMHSFRPGNDSWYKHLGLKSSSHGPQKPISIQFVEKDHPITKGLEDWTTGNEELYNNVDVFDARPLAMGKQIIKQGDTEKEAAAIVVWTNEKQGAPSFSTTIGHNTSTVSDGRYLDLVTRGLLWACGKLNDDYLGLAYTGPNKVTFVPAKPKEEPKKVTMGEAPKDATLVVTSASSEETGKNNFAWRAVDGSRDTRWCAAGPKTPQWLTLELDKEHELSGIDLIWESGNTIYRRKIELSNDGNSWTTAVDATSEKKKGNTQDAFEAQKAKFVRITCTSTIGGWASIREVKLKSPTIKSLFPKLAEDQKKQVAAVKKDESDPYKKQGNITPKIVKLSSKEEDDILKQVKVPEEFDVTVFSSWQAANYPVYVAASPSGDLYVASDGNGSLGRDPGRGRVMRLRDTDNDGRADQVTEFIKDIDSPRGLIWDHDRLYVLHPPNISVYFDKNHDGVAEESKTLIEGIAFGFKDRPADHTTNGIDIGIDGWIYIAGGDFGFMNAKGTDGTELQHRGGGVIRFRPDGSGLELFSTGTRNILGTPISPTLDIFARDNTNDGGGWDVRFHHFTGLEDHGYPRKYKNFTDEHIHPLADYGGGSGCGSMYLSEPGYPEKWNNAPMTCDWGTGALWKHTVEKAGATFKETEKPEKFISLPRPTDADVDGLSAIYQASWKGPATFRWEGPETGYIVKVTPKGYQPEPLPDFAKMSGEELLNLITTTSSQVRRTAAQRMLIRKSLDSGLVKKIQSAATDKANPIAARVAALYTLVLGSENASAPVQKEIRDILTSFAFDPEDELFAALTVRALADVKFPKPISGQELVSIINWDWDTKSPRMKIETMITAARTGSIETANYIARRLGDSDPVIAHTAFQSLAKLKASDACFKVLDGDAGAEQKKGAAFALMRMHLPEVVDGSISRLKTEKRPVVRENILSILCRLYHVEAEWKGDSWGTRPDTRGPYYSPTTWEQSEKILAALKTTLTSAGPEETAHLVAEMNRNRIQSDEAQSKIITMAKDDPSLIPTAVAQIAATGNVTPDSVPLLIKAANDPESKAATLAQSIAALAKSDDTGALSAMLAALGSLDKVKGSGKEQTAGREAFLKAPKLENHHLAIEKMAAQNFGTRENVWANAALLALAERKNGSPESREMSNQALDQAWQNPEHKVVLMNTIADRIYTTHYLDDRILVALNDPDSKVAKAASKAAGRLKLQKPGEDKTPKIGTLKPEDAIAQVTKMKGDVALGESVFARAICTSCHTTNQDQQQKGPYLGNIAKTYNRQQLAEAIILPNKTIAQGFKTNVITLEDGSMQMGFVTDEANETVTIRDIAANEHSFAKSKIKKRDTLPTSMMPPGLVNGFSVREVSSLLDYLAKLSK